MTSTATARTKPSQNGALRPIDRVLHQLERKGCKVSPGGDRQWKSQCPCHEGKSQNLSIKETDDGTVIMHCHHKANGHETCSAAAIAESLGLEMKDLFPRNTGSSPVSRKRSKPPPARAHPTPEAALDPVVKQLGEPSASWVYNDPEGYELMRVYRFDLADGKKQFRPVHPYADGWRLGDPPGKLPLYRLDRLGRDETVWILEGEKCADLVGNLGLVSTTSSHGSEGAAKTDWSPLAGRSVVIVPDNDGPGEGYASSVAVILATLEPRPDVRILRLPVRHEEDVEQWLASLPDGWTPEQCGRELARLAPDVPRWSPPVAPPVVPAIAKTGPPGDSINMTDWGNAKRLVAAHGDQVRFCKPLGHWLKWDGRRWSPDRTGAIWRLAKDTVRRLGHEAADTEDDQRRKGLLRWALESEEKKLMASMIDLAWSEPGIPVLPDELDRDPWLLNTPSGTVELRTGRLRPHRQGDLISKITRVPFDPAAECPRWKEALSLIFAGDQDLIAYVQRALGYSLTGDTGEHCLFLCYGTGRNGKNTVLDTVRTILEDYATVASPRTFLATGQNEHPTMLADLVGRRFVPTSEVEEGERLAESLVKRVTGDRTLKARFMRQDPFEFPVLFKLWMLANCKPEIRGRDEGIWSRIRIIPFDVFIPADQRIRNLSDILVREEGPGILRWLVEGCLEWQRSGLSEPQRVKDAVGSYRSEQDVIGNFLGECCISHLHNEVLREKARVRARDLYDRYVDWCKENREENTLSSRKFGGEMERRGYALKPSNSVQYRLGLELKPSAESTQDSASDSAH
jgi:putative DNA primase/helicase